MSLTNTTSSFGARFLTLAALAGGLGFAVDSGAADAVRYTTKFGSKVSIAGTSSIHAWNMDGQIIQGFFEVPAGVVLDPAQANLAGVTDGKLNAKVETMIPVRSLKSTHSGMDEVMQQAMNAESHPKIQFSLTEMVLKGPHAAGTPLQFDTKGDLVVNGITNKIAIPVSIEAADKGKLKVVGMVPLKMTDFKVKPPAPAVGLGLITTGDEVKISFEWLIALAAPAK